MQQVVLTIEDQNIEHAIAEIAQNEGINIQEFMMQAIQSFIKQKSSFVYKLAPIPHSTQIRYEVSEEDVTDAKPFVFVKDSAKFGKELRERVWRRREHG